MACKLDNNDGCTKTVRTCCLVCVANGENDCENNYHTLCGCMDEVQYAEDCEYWEREEKQMKRYVALLLVVVLVLSAGVPANAKTRKYATCSVAVEDGIWIYDTYKINVDSFEKHHIGEYKEGKRFKVYETKEGMARIKYKGKRAWIPTKNIEVVKNGWVKIEGKWKKVKKGFSFWMYIKYGESGY